MVVLLAGRAGAQGSVLLVGGGSEEYNDWSDRPYRWLVEQAPNRNILILHYATASTFLPAYFQWLGAAGASNLVIPTTEAANDSANYRAILAADGLFLRGGDQWEYVRLWKGTLAQRAIRAVFLRGGVVGGTSAGLAVLTDLVFNSRTTITIVLAARTRCTLAVHDVLGRQVAHLADGAELGPGRIEFSWDAAGAASGTYFVRLRSAKAVATLPVQLLR